jgi:hypothetical protein
LIRFRRRSTLTVAVIGTTQTLAWASSYYLPAILADPIAAGLGVTKLTTAAAPLLFGLLLDAMGTGALLVSAGLSLAALATLGLLRAQPASASA